MTDQICLTVSQISALLFYSPGGRLHPWLKECFHKFTNTCPGIWNNLLFLKAETFKTAQKLYNKEVSKLLQTIISDNEKYCRYYL